MAEISEAKAAAGATLGGALGAIGAGAAAVAIGATGPLGLVAMGAGAYMGAKNGAENGPRSLLFPWLGAIGGFGGGGN